MGELMAVAAGFFFGVSNITVRQGQLQGQYCKLRGLFVAILVNNIINCLVLTVMFLSGAAFSSLNTPAVLFFAGGGILTTFLGRILLFGSIEFIGPSRAGTLKIIAPVFTLLIGVFFLKEKLTFMALSGIILVFSGAFLCSREVSAMKTEYSKVKEVKNQTYVLGLFLAFFAGLSLGTGNVFRKLGVMHYGEPVIGVTIGSLVSLLVMLFYFLFQKRVLKVLAEVPAMLRGGGYLWTGVLTSLALYATFTALLYSPVSIVNSIKATEPLFTILASYLFLKKYELLSARLIRDTLIIVTGVVLIFIGA